MRAEHIRYYCKYVDLKCIHGQQYQRKCNFLSTCSTTHTHSHAHMPVYCVHMRIFKAQSSRSLSCRSFFSFSFIVVVGGIVQVSCASFAANVYERFGIDCMRSECSHGRINSVATEAAPAIWLHDVDVDEHEDDSQFCHLTDYWIEKKTYWNLSYGVWVLTRADRWHYLPNCSFTRHIQRTLPWTSGWMDRYSFYYYIRLSSLDMQSRCRTNFCKNIIYRAEVSNHRLPSWCDDCGATVRCISCHCHCRAPAE